MKSKKAPQPIRTPDQREREEKTKQEEKRKSWQLCNEEKFSVHPAAAYAYSRDNSDTQTLRMRQERETLKSEPRSEERTDPLFSLPIPIQISEVCYRLISI